MIRSCRTVHANISLRGNYISCQTTFDASDVGRHQEQVKEGVVSQLYRYSAMNLGS